MNEDQWISQFLALLEMRGWKLAIPNAGDDDPVIGMVIGTDEYIDWVTSGKFLQHEKYEREGGGLVH